jgi:hypothetical protein
MSERTAKQFMQATRGLSVTATYKMLDRATPGVTWIGCSKGLMARSWAEATSVRYKGSREYALMALTLDKLELLAEAARKEVREQRLRAVNWNNYGRGMFEALVQVATAKDAESLHLACVRASQYADRIRKEEKL